MKIGAYIVYGVNEALYKLFGVNTPVRKAWLKQQSYEIQNALSVEHKIKDIVNARINGVYTTKRAMEIAEEANWI